LIAVSKGFQNPEKVHFIIRSNTKVKKLIESYKKREASSFEGGIFPPNIKFYSRGKEINEDENFISVWNLLIKCE
jgi:hypothetical protein